MDTMKKILWSDKFTVKNHVIDDQHLKLFSLYNNLVDSIGSSSGFNSNEIIMELVKFINTHFTYEEKLLQNANYPELREHKELHTVFVDQISDFAIKAITDEQEEFKIELALFLETWLVDHILQEDQKYVSSLK